MGKGKMVQPTKNELRATIAFLEGEVQRLQAELAAARGVVAAMTQQGAQA